MFSRRVSNRFAALATRRVHRRRTAVPRRSFRVARKAGYNKPSSAGRKPYISARALYPVNNVSVTHPDYNREPYANREYFELRGSMHFAPTGTTGGLFSTVSKIFLNDIWVPFSGGAMTSTPPYGYAQMAERYQRYKVTRCVIRLTFYNTNSTSAICMTLPQSNEDTYTFGSEDVRKTRQKPGVEWVLGCEVPQASNTSSAPCLKKLYDLTPWRVEGMTAAQWLANDTDMTGAFGSSPARRPFLAFGCGDTQGLSTSGMLVDADVTYFGFAYERNTQNAS